MGAVDSLHYYTMTNQKNHTSQKDVGMGLCTFNFVLRLSLHLVCLLFVTSSLHLFFFKFYPVPTAVPSERYPVAVGVVFRYPVAVGA